jgi:tetratricopeptide (TPR) repeat protein
VARNIDRKELKNPDQFVSFWTHVGAFLNKHRIAVLAGVGGALVLGIGAWAISTTLSKRAADNSAAFARIERVANAPLLEEKQPAPPDDGLPHFKTEDARLEAALKETDTFLAQHGGSDFKDEALLLKAKYLLALGKNSEALAIYQGQLGGIDRRLHFIAQEGLGYALEATGQIDSAITAFGTLADESQAAAGFYRDRALFNKARLLEKKGSAKEAEKVLHDILEKTPTTPLREEINDRLAALEGK